MHIKGSIFYISDSVGVFLSFVWRHIDMFIYKKSKQLPDNYILHSMSHWGCVTIHIVSSDTFPIAYEKLSK